MYRKVELAECANTITDLMTKGVFLTTRAGDKINSMVIEWGHLGRIWNRPVFIAFVRTSRFTKEQLDKNAEFTVNFPIHGYSKEAFAVCGTKSGRDMDKIGELGLTPVDPRVISVPGLKEFPLTLECRVIYSQKQDASQLPEDIREKFYKWESAEHICYYGEILDSYVIEED